MKRQTIAALFVFFPCFALGCSAALNKAVIKGVVETSLAACIAENPGADKKELQTLCHFLDDAWPVVEVLLESQKKGLAKATHMKADSGIADAGKD